MQGFAELVAGGSWRATCMSSSCSAMINLQIRRLSQGRQSCRKRCCAMRCSSSRRPIPQSATVRQLRQAYALDGLVPADYELRRYGQIDTEALERAKEGMAQAKARWAPLAADDRSGTGCGLRRALAEVAAECDKLDIPGCTCCANWPMWRGRRCRHGRGEELALEMATALLFAEHHLAHIRHLPDDFAAHADTIGARLLALVAGETPPAPVQWQNGLARHAAGRYGGGAGDGEMKTGLRQVEKVLDEFYADPSRRAALGGWRRCCTSW
jgi:chemosensory pili system protein ChpA (sensor histidine kinase/response regulator)